MSTFPPDVLTKSHENSMLHWLPDIKVYDLEKTAGDSTPKDSTPKKEATGTFTSYANQRYDSEYKSPSFIAQDRLDISSDKFGKELKGNGTIWRIYKAEAELFDRELVDARDKRLDMMLLFAGLFCSVLTGFLVESVKLLQQDPEGASLDILLLIAQSQQRVENNTPRLQLPEVKRPEFTIPTSARWINGLWFLSLIISLTGALLSMVAREWLVAFTNSRPHSPHAFALLHQARLRGMDKWEALHIIDFLPTVLQCALFLFAMGLVIYLWTLDPIIAIIVATVSATTLLSYVATAIAVALADFCPFVTQASKYFQRLRIPDMVAHADKMSKDADGSKWTTLEELQALKWLVKHARNPDVGKAVHQALSGLRVWQGDRDLPEGDNVTNQASQEREREEYKHTLRCITQSKTLPKFLSRTFDDICQKLPRILEPGVSKIPEHRARSLSKYANALPHLAQLLQLTKLNSESVVPKQFILRSRYLTLQRRQAQSIQEPIDPALGALGRVWDKDVPYLSADTYALLIIAELRLIEDAAQPLSALFQNSANNSAVVIALEETPSLFTLRARYSRALFRAGVQLSNYAMNKVQISPNTLKNLVQSIQEAFLCNALNPRKDSISTHHPQIPKHKYKGPFQEDTAHDSRWISEGYPTFASMLAGTNILITLNPTALADKYGLLYGLLHMIGRFRITDAPDLTIATRKAFHTVVPILLEQWFFTVARGYPRKDEVTLDDLDRAQEQLNLIRPGGDGSSRCPWLEISELDEKEEHIDNRDITVMRQLVITAQIGIAWSRLGYPGICQLATHALRALTNLATASYGQFQLLKTFQLHHVLFEDLLKLATDSNNLGWMNNDTHILLVQLLNPKVYEDCMLQSLGDQPSALICMHQACHIRELKICTWKSQGAIHGLMSTCEKYLKRSEEQMTNQPSLLKELLENDLKYLLPHNLSQSAQLPNSEAQERYLTNLFVQITVSTFPSNSTQAGNNQYWEQWPSDVSLKYFSELLYTFMFAARNLQPEDPRWPEFSASVASAIEMAPENIVMESHAEIVSFFNDLLNSNPTKNIPPQVQHRLGETLANLPSNGPPKKKDDESEALEINTESTSVECIQLELNRMIQPLPWNAHYLPIWQTNIQHLIILFLSDAFLEGCK